MFQVGGFVDELYNRNWNCIGGNRSITDNPIHSNLCYQWIVCYGNSIYMV